MATNPYEVSVERTLGGWAYKGAVFTLCWTIRLPSATCSSTAQLAQHIFFIYCFTSLCLNQTHASPFSFYCNSILTPYSLLAIDWNIHVLTEAFDRECKVQYKRLSSNSSSDGYDSLKLWGSDDASSTTSVDSSAHGVPKLEAYLYFYGLRGNRKLGPKLIWRSSTDVFTPPSGPSQDVRAMQLLTVHEHVKLGKEKDLWPKIRKEVRDFPQVRQYVG